MLDAAAEAADFIEGRVVEDLARDRVLLLALVKEIEIVGEAATQISAELRDSSPEIPRAQMRGMRNRLIHAYSDVNIELVWSTVVSDLPGLVNALQRCSRPSTDTAVRHVESETGLGEQTARSFRTIDASKTAICAVAGEGAAG